MFARLWRIIGGVEPPEDTETPAILRASTHSVVLRLDPKLMKEPDLQVRWEIERLLKAVAPPIRFVDDGYGFAKSSDAMLLSYATPEPDRLIEALVTILEQELVLGNQLAPAAMLAVAPLQPDVEAGKELEGHTMVYPASEAGKPMPD